MKQFVDITEKSATQRLSVRNNALEPRPDWWGPDNASDFETIRYIRSDIRDPVELLIDNSTEDEVTVYILQLR